MRRTLTRILPLAFLAALLPCALAYAGGGTTIANAPVIIFGQQQFGDTSHLGFNNGGDSIWKAPLIAGDRLVVDWETSVRASNADPQPGVPVVEWVEILPPGVNDFNASDDQRIYQEDLNFSTMKAEAVFTPKTSGTYLLVFISNDSGDGGPFDFVASVKHRVVMRFSSPSSVSPHGTLSVSFHTPDGQPISNGLTASLYGTWGGMTRLLGRARPTPTGVVRFTLHLGAALRGQTIRVRVVANGESYLGASKQALLTIR